MYRIAIALLVSLLAACSAPKYTVDDGRKIDEVLLANIRNYGSGEKAIRSGIGRTSALKDPDCDTQWELPFSVESSYRKSDNDKVAWVRALGVDERLTVVGSASGSPLKVGDKIKEVDGYGKEDTEKMALKLADKRDSGKPFKVKLFDGNTVRVTPLKVCRGYARLAPPTTPKLQDYHWLLTVHPLEVARADLTEDEGLWAVLWGQGVSEEGGGRMKTYAYGTQVAGSLYTLFTVASGLQGASLAVNAASQAAQAAANTVATEAIKRQLVDQATAAAANRLRGEATDVVRKLTQSQVTNALQQAAVNRGSLSGVAWIASSVFEQADAWAFKRMEQLGADPLASFTLHQKLVERGLTANSMVLDPDRLAALSKIAEARGKGDDVIAILQGVRPEDLQVAMADMPLASAPGSFSYETEDAPSKQAQPFARGLVDGMLNMPVQSNE